MDADVLPWVTVLQITVHVHDNTVQWLVGFLSFLLPFSKQNFRLFLRPIHVYNGVLLFFFVIATSYVGMTQVLIKHT